MPTIRKSMLAFFDVSEITRGATVEAVIDVVALTVVTVAVITNFTGTECDTSKEPSTNRFRVDKASINIFSKVSW